MQLALDTALFGANRRLTPVISCREIDIVRREAALILFCSAADRTYHLGNLYQNPRIVGRALVLGPIIFLQIGRVSTVVAGTGRSQFHWLVANRAVQC